MTVIDEIAAERKRQIEQEGWSADHDKHHCRGEMALAGACYAIISTYDNNERRAHTDAIWGIWRGFNSVIADLWQWEATWFKPKNPRRDLIRAGALIVAEIERLDREEAKSAA